jgi:hypothetical protein
VYDIRRTPSTRAAEQAMPESLSVAFGVVLEAIAADPWSVGRPFGPRTPARIETFGLGGRGMVLFTIHDEGDPHVRLQQITF